jgi:phosphoglycolate phosphatase-like HAD superfamily hydrolase
MTKRHLFLDFDGVLVDSNAVKTGAFFDLATKFFGTEAAEGLVENHQQNPGGSRFTKLAWLLSNYHPNQPILNQSQLESEFSSRVLEKIRAANRTPRLASLLRDCNYVPHILTAAPSMEITDLVESFGWEVAFESRIHGSPESKVDHLNKLGKLVDLENSIFVGDAPSDFEVARQFGIPFVFVSDWTEWSPSQPIRSEFVGSWPNLEHFLTTLLKRSESEKKLW